MSRDKRAAFAVMATVLLCSMTFALWWPRDDAARPGSLAAVVALSSDIYRDSSIGRYGEGRLRSAMELVRRTGAPLLVTSRIQRRGGPTSDWAQRNLIVAGG